MSKVSKLKRKAREAEDEGDRVQAIAPCHNVLRVAPDQVDAHLQLASLHAETGLVAEAASSPRVHPRPEAPWRRAWRAREAVRERAAASAAPPPAALGPTAFRPPLDAAAWRDRDAGGARIRPGRVRPAGPPGPLFATPGRQDYLPAGAEVAGDADGGAASAAAGRETDQASGESPESGAAAPWRRPEEETRAEDDEGDGPPPDFTDLLHDIGWLEEDQRRAS